MSNKKKNIHFSFIFSFIISFEYSSDGCIIFEENNKFVIKNIFNLQCNFDRIVAHDQKKKKWTIWNYFVVPPIPFFFFFYIITKQVERYGHKMDASVRDLIPYDVI